MSPLPYPPLRFDAKYNVLPSLDKRSEKSSPTGSLISGPALTGSVHAEFLSGRVDRNMSCCPARADVNSNSVSSGETVGLPSNRELFTSGPRLCAGPNSQPAVDALCADGNAG